MSTAEWAMVTKYIPSRFSNGIDKRVALLAHALSSRYRLHLHVLLGAAPTNRHDPELWERLESLTFWTKRDKADPFFSEKFRGFFEIKQFEETRPYQALIQELRELPLQGVVIVAPLMLNPRMLPSSIVQTYDLCEVRSGYSTRFSSLLTNLLERDQQDREAQHLAKWEQLFLPHFDLVTVCSEPEKLHLHDRYQSPLPLSTWPNPCWACVETPLEEINPVPTSLLFVGELSYNPNLDAVRWLVDEILPALRSLGVHLPLKVVGFHPPDLIIEAEKQGKLTLVTGAKDLRPHYQDAALCLVPLRHGAGTRLKILEAFAYGVPVVSTSKGAEGLPVESGKQLLLADEADTFAQVCLTALTDVQKTSERVRHARHLVQQEFHPDRISETILAHTERLVAAKARLSPS
ncbi:MAG: glycosyltransferase family 4 protein [Verrucomicrobiales bacterium]